MKLRLMVDDAADTTAHAGSVGATKLVAMAILVVVESQFGMAEAAVPLLYGLHSCPIP